MDEWVIDTSTNCAKEFAYHFPFTSVDAASDKITFNREGFIKCWDNYYVPSLKLLMAERNRYEARIAKLEKKIDSMGDELFLLRAKKDTNDDRVIH